MVYTVRLQQAHRPITPFRGKLVRVVLAHASFPQELALAQNPARFKVMDRIPMVFLTVKIGMFATGTFFAITWQPDWAKKKKK